MTSQYLGEWKDPNVELPEGTEKPVMVVLEVVATGVKQEPSGTIWNGEAFEISDDTVTIVAWSDICAPTFPL